MVALVIKVIRLSAVFSIKESSMTIEIDLHEDAPQDPVIERTIGILKRLDPLAKQLREFWYGASLTPPTPTKAFQGDFRAEDYDVKVVDVFATPTRSKLIIGAVRRQIAKIKHTFVHFRDLVSEEESELFQRWMIAQFCKVERDGKVVEALIIHPAISRLMRSLPHCFESVSNRRNDRVIGVVWGAAVQTSKALKPGEVRFMSHKDQKPGQACGCRPPHGPVEHCPAKPSEPVTQPKESTNAPTN